MTNAANEAIRTSTAGRVLTVTIDRPEARNALRVVDKRRITEIVTAVTGADVGCIVLTGAGAHAFCAGSDLKEMSGMDSASFLAMQEVERAMYDAMMRCPVPIVAAVHGWALGTGCVLAAVSDLVLADPDSRFGQPEILNGAPTPIHGALLPQIVGLARARWLVLTGRTIDAELAERWGLVNEVTVAGGVLEAATALGAELGQIHPGSMALQKRIVDSWVRHPFDAAVSASMYIAASAYDSGWPQSAAERMRGRSLRGRSGTS